MSLCKITRVAKAHKDQRPCGRCGTAITAGDAYLWWKGRYTSKQVRCTKPACKPETWELETNPLRSARMQADDALATAREALESAKSLIEEVVDSLEERVSSWDGTGLENSQQYEACSASRDELQEWINSCDNWISEMEDLPELDLGA